MTTSALGVFVLIGLIVGGRTPDDRCAATRTFVLTRAITPVIGQSPIWVTAGRGPLVWPGADKAIELLIVRDRAVPGLALIVGRNRQTGVPVKFTKTGSTLGIRNEKFQLDAIGLKPRTATAPDFNRYTFHTADLWVGGEGCYELVARVGRQMATMYLQVERRGNK
ncbi:MAG: hypothetical protein HYX76_01530 [Acidobacteria bacterium]|nr:hypothetical protein [Acidobacteriota bacterium]